MEPVPSSEVESVRLKALREYGVLDTLPEEALDDLTAMAAKICGTSIALITLVDENRQWFKSKVGLDVSETARDISFCSHAIRQNDLLVVTDATNDARFADNPMVKGEPHIRFYAGAQLVAPNGSQLGTLCVIDKEPHTLTALQEQVLRILAQQVMTHLELRRKTRALVRSEEQLELVTRKARVGLILLDREQCFVFVNKTYRELMGLQGDDLVGQRLQDVLADVYEDQIRPRVERAFAGERVEYELRKPSAHGDLILDVKYEPIWENGVVAFAVVVVMDVTATRQAEESSRMFRERLEVVARTSSDRIWDWDLTTNALWWNEGYHGFFDYRPDETNPSIEFWTSHIHPDERERVMADIKDAIDGEGVEWNDEYRFQRSDGSYAWIYDRGHIMRDENGKAVRMIGAMEDITERKQAEVRLAEQAAILDQAQDAIVVRSLDGKIVFWSLGAQRMYGWTGEEAIGRSISELLYSNREEFRVITEAILDRGEWYGKPHLVRKDGAEVIVEFRGTLVKDEKGNPKSIVSISTDITEKTRLEAQLLRAQRMESIGALAGGIAHDLNNILAPIIMATQLLKESATDAEERQMLETIEVSSKRGSDIVRQVLSFARGTDGERTEIDFKTLLADIATITRNSFPKNIRIECSTPDHCWRVFGDATQLHQLLLNLCVNSRDALAEGGIISISIENFIVDAQYAAIHPEAKTGPYVVLCVTDTGTGIPPEVVSRIFEPFFTTKTVERGTGLGLSTVMAIVKNHNGFLNVYSEVGRGTTIRASFPALDGSEKELQEGARTDSLPRGRGETVLVIDDEASILVITGQTLEAFGYVPLTARNGSDAAAIYAQKPDQIAVVLTDMSMPVMDGPATIRALRNINPKVRIIGASGLRTGDMEAEQRSLGINYFLSKPYTTETLLKLLRQVLDS